MSSSEHDLLPRYVTIGSNPRAGVIHRDMFGGWHASNWNGPLGTFVTAEEAEQAIRSAPAWPKKKRPPEARNFLGFEKLVDDGNTFVLDGDRKVGAVTRRGDIFVAWSRTAKLGEFATAAKASEAVRNAQPISRNSRPAEAKRPRQRRGRS